MKKLLRKEFKDSKHFMILLCSVIVIIYSLISQLVNLNSHEIPTDYLDITLPVVVLLIVFRNFKYLRDENYVINIFGLPLSKEEIFKAKYLLSVIQIVIIVGLLFVTTIVSTIMIETISFNISYFLNGINRAVYYSAVLLKGIISVGFLNIVLMFYLKGRDLYSCILYTVMGAFVVSSFNSMFYVILENYISVNSGSIGYLLPSGIYSYSSVMINNMVFMISYDFTKIMIHLVISLIILGTLFLGISVIKRALKIEIEDIGRREYKSSYLYPILISSVIFMYSINIISYIEIFKLILSLLVLVVSFILIYLFNNKLKFKINELLIIVIILIINICTIIYFW